MKSPTCVKKVHMLNGHFVALNWFLSQSTDKCKSFFQAIKRNGVDFCWNEECEATFLGLKKYLASPPLMSKPVTGETLLLYPAVSKSAVNGVLVREDGGVQKPVYYVNMSLLSPETRY